MTYKWQPYHISYKLQTPQKLSNIWQYRDYKWVASTLHCGNCHTSWLAVFRVTNTIVECPHCGAWNEY